MQLETERLIIRDFVADDLDDVYAYGGDPEVVRYMPFPPSTREGTKEHLERCMALAQEQPRRWYDMGIELKSEGRIIGGCTLDVFDHEQGHAAFSYLFNQAYWGRGYATEALQALLHFGFEELGLHHIGDSCDAENTGSACVMEKCGLRLIEQRDGELHYAITLEEWNKVRQ